MGSLEFNRKKCYIELKQCDLKCTPLLRSGLSVGNDAITTLNKTHISMWAFIEHLTDESEEKGYLN